MGPLKFRTFASVTVLISLTACGIGPHEISAERADYNDIIQETSKKQIFENIIRVKNHEPMQFMDVAQISAAQTLHETAIGQVSAIGSGEGAGTNSRVGQVGQASLQLEYVELPTITYQPLQGAQMVQQTTTPITVDTLANLYDTEWPVSSVFTFIFDRLTPAPKTGYAAINYIGKLDSKNALTVAPISTELSGGQSRDCTVTAGPVNGASSTKVTISAPCSGMMSGSSGAAGAQTKDTLGLYLTTTRPESKSLDGEKDAKESMEILEPWIGLLTIYKNSQVYLPSKIGTDRELNNNISQILLDNINKKKLLIKSCLGAQNYSGHFSSKECRDVMKLVDDLFDLLPKHIELRTVPLIKQQAQEKISQIIANNMDRKGRTEQEITNLSNKYSQSAIQQLFLGPVVRPLSALGVLKTAFNDNPTIEVINRDEQSKNYNEGIEVMLNNELNAPDGHENFKDYYTYNDWHSGLNSSNNAGSNSSNNVVYIDDSKVVYIKDNKMGCYNNEEKVKVKDGNAADGDKCINDRSNYNSIENDIISNAKAKNHCNDINDVTNNINVDEIAVEECLGALRRYVLIFSSKSEPDPAKVYVKYFDNNGSLWYYIDRRDKISRENFGLIGQILTMQAAPPAPLPVSSTTNVGGR